MAPKHFRRFSGNRFYFDANLLSLPGELNILVIGFDGGDYANVHKLQGIEI